MPPPKFLVAPKRIILVSVIIYMSKFQYTVQIFFLARQNKNKKCRKKRRLVDPSIIDCLPRFLRQL